MNINPSILAMYLEHLLPEIAAPGDDHNYGSSAMNDVTALQVGWQLGGRRDGCAGGAGEARSKSAATAGPHAPGMHRLAVTWPPARRPVPAPRPSPSASAAARLCKLTDCGQAPVFPMRLPAWQALSKRIHYGMFVAEAKFRKQTAEYSELIKKQDAAAILELLTDRAVELKVGAGWACRGAGCRGAAVLAPAAGGGRAVAGLCCRPRRQLEQRRRRAWPAATSATAAADPSRRPQVIERVRLKAATFGQDLGSGAGGAGGGDSAGSAYKVRPEVVAQLYEQWVMPLTKEVEVQYLLRRLDGEPGGAAGGR